MAVHNATTDTYERVIAAQLYRYFLSRVDTRTVAYWCAVLRFPSNELARRKACAYLKLTHGVDSESLLRLQKIPVREIELFVTLYHTAVVLRRYPLQQFFTL